MTGARRSPVEPATRRGPDVLFVSNGFGETAIATYIARALAQERPQATIEHLALVGPLPAHAWPPSVGPQRAMPSGGLISYGNVRNLMRDLRAGLLALTLRQFGFLARQRKRDAVVAVGDVYCLAACLLFAARPTVFVATAKSQDVAAHSKLECLIARRARLTFARDRATADALARSGVKATWAGNVMMDGLSQEDADLPVSADAVCIGVLPGSRADAVANVRRSIRRVRKIARLLEPDGRRVQILISVSPSTDAADVVRELQGEGFAMQQTGRQTGVVAEGRAGAVSVLAVKEHFGALLRCSDIVLGQAGTGNEQAAGAGRPVVAALEPRERADKMGWYRMRQKRLLGDALYVASNDDDEFAGAVVRLLKDPQRRQAMAQAGRERMGPPGAAARVADAIVRMVEDT